MKKFIFIIFFFCVNSLLAQNYQNICTTGTTLYKPVSTYFKAFRLDSLEPLGNNDTMFISYRTIRDTSYWDCRDTTNGSILGREILKKHNGWFYFFNSLNDSIRLNTQATLNETWKFCDLPNNCYVQAKVTSIINDSVLGMIDQVKIITFQAKNSSNVNISNILNQKYIKLSQHWGLSQMLDVYFIPTDTMKYVLVGKTVLVLGIQNITWQQIFDFNVGDEFDYFGGEISGYYQEYHKYEIYNVLEKTAYGNDSVIYSMEYCRRDTILETGVITTVHDTITVNYNFQQLANDNASWFNKLPEEFLNQVNVANTYTRNFAYNNRQTKSITIWGDLFYSSPPCWSFYYPQCDYAPLQYKYNYAEGLGSVYYSEFCTSLGGGHSVINNLVYYKKGSETWGTPVALNCWVLTSAESLQEKVDRAIHIVPNPVETESKIWFDTQNQNEKVTFVLTDYLGRNVTQFYTESLPYTFNRTGLPNGIYIITVYDKEGVLKGRAKLIIL